MATKFPFEAKYLREAAAYVWPDDVEFPLPIEETSQRLGEVHFAMQTRGYFDGVEKVTALVIERRYPLVPYDSATVVGVRSMARPSEDGYVLRGWVSVGGANRKAHTGATDFLVKGRHVKVATLITLRKGTP